MTFFNFKHEIANFILHYQYFTNNIYDPCDFKSTPANIVSERFMNVIRSLNKNITDFESQIIYDGKNKKNYLETNGTLEMWGKYFTVIFPMYELMNMEKSEYELENVYMSDETFIADIYELVIDKNKMEKVAEDNFFVLKEMSMYLLCTEKAKHAIEDAGLKGIGFVEINIE